MSKRIPTAGASTRASTSSASASELMKPASSRCEPWIGSNPTRTPAASAAAADARERVDDAAPSPRSRSDRRAARRGTRRRPARSAANRRTDASSAANPLLDVGRPLHAGDRERQDRRHRRHADRHAEAVLAQQRDVRLVVLGQLELPQPDRVEARPRRTPRRPRRTSRRAVEISESDVITRGRGSGIRASRRCGIGGFVSSFATR